MTTESKARAAAIKARREELGISFDGFYDQLSLTNRQATFVEDGRYGAKTTEHRDKAEKFLDHLEQKVGKARKTPTATPEKEKQFILPHGHDSKPWPASRYMIVTRDARSVTTVADQLHRRREDLGVTVMGMAEAFGLSIDIVISVEQGVYNENWVERANLFWDFYDQHEQAADKAPEQTRKIVKQGSTWHWATHVPAGATITFRVLPGNGDKFTEEELAAFPPLDLTPKPTPEYKAHRMINDKKATQKQLEKFADGLCLSLLKAERDIVTIPWAEFYEMLYAATGAGHFDQTLLDTIFSNMTTTSVPFLISFANNVVVVCKDALFAPVEYP